MAFHDRTRVADQMTDPTVLHTAATSILTALEAGALDADWEPQGCVTYGEPAYDCDSIYVWVDSIEAETEAQCHIATRVTFRYAIGICIGGGQDEDCAFWDGVAADANGKIWATWVGLVDAWVTGTLCAVPCTDIRAGDPLQILTNDGGVAVWSGTVTVTVSPVAAL